VTKAGAGTLSLTAANSYGGNTTVSAGTLAVAGGSIGNSPVVSVAAGATLDVSAAGWSGNGSQFLDSPSTAGTSSVNLAGQSFTLSSGDGLSFQAIGGGTTSAGSFHTWAMGH